jgi:hypothetical protein
MTALDVPYVAGIQPNTLMWRSGTGPRRKGKPLNNTGRRDEPDLISAKEVMLGLPKRAWHTVRWREGSMDLLSSRFARVRVGVGHNRLDPGSLLWEWLLIEWPEDEAEAAIPRTRRRSRSRIAGLPSTHPSASCSQW